jgi:hypothetical protein
VAGQAKIRKLRVAAAVEAEAAYTIEISARTAQRLLERACLAQGAAQAAQQVVATARALQTAFDEHAAEVADAPVGAAVKVDFEQRTITVTPRAPAPEPPPADEAAG